MEQSIIPVSLAERLVTYAVVFHELLRRHIK